MDNMKRDTLNSRAFLKKCGLLFDRKPAQLDRAFLKSFPDAARAKIEMILTMLHGGFAKIGALYSLPHTQTQASLLFSHDANRLTASLDWFADVVDQLTPRSVIEVGCGAGYLLRYLRYLHPEITLTGLDRQQNLLELIPGEARIRTVVGDYLATGAEELHDLVICDFGWDNSDIPISTKAHSEARLANLSYCPGCSDDAIPFFESLLEACQSRCSNKGKIALVGRAQNVGVVRAIYMAAAKKGWELLPSGFDVIILKHDRRKKEVFPAFLFSREPSTLGLSLEDVAHYYAEAQ